MKHIVAVWVFCAFALLSGCRSEPDIVAATQDGNTRTLDITVKAVGLGDYSPELLAGEAKISELDILAFNAATGDKTFLFRVTPLSQTEIDETTVRITAEVPY
ncbi:MAG: hypothetical protein LUD76_07620, partial [Alistipes sp.]|nr:hypothetical protein [Alistipes sp.]